MQQYLYRPITLFSMMFSMCYYTGLEARGFLFGPMIAQHLNASFVPIRKKGKLPGECVKVEYSLEYGTVSTLISKLSLI